MNNQQLVELSEKIRDHLTTQKVRAMAEVPVPSATPNDTAPRCRYRGDNGTMCAVGCLIPDERYDESMEGYSAGEGRIMRAVFGDAWNTMPIAFMNAADMLLRNWQHYHDHGDYRLWCDGEAAAMSPAEMHQRALKSGSFEVEV